MIRQFIQRPNGRAYPLRLSGFLCFPDQPLPTRCTSTSIASREILFTTEQPLECNPLDTAKLELAWPATLADGTPLKLCLWGTILQVQDTLVQFRVRKYEFRTRSRGRKAAAA